MDVQDVDHKWETESENGIGRKDKDMPTTYSKYPFFEGNCLKNLGFHGKCLLFL